MKRLLKRTVSIVLAFSLVGVIFMYASGNAPFSDNSYKSEAPEQLISAEGDGKYDATIQTISMKEGKDFVIMGLTDTHINGLDSLKTFLRISGALIDAHKPDLVILNGDNIDNWNDHCRYLGYKSGAVAADKISGVSTVAGFFKEKYEQYGTKWCALMGNHDRDDNASGENRGRGNGTWQQNDFYMGLAAEGTYGCMYTEGVVYNTLTDGYYDDYVNMSWAQGEQKAWFDKYGDYIINIKDGDEVIYSVVMMDSGQHEAPGSLKNGYISAEQVEWYKEQMKANAIAKYGKFDLEAGYFIPSLIFIHQPLPEYTFAALEGIGSSGVGLVKEDFGFGYGEEYPAGKVQREDVNYGLFDAAKEVGGTHFFTGHNHGNNSSILYDGIWLNFLNRTGCRSSESASWTDERIGYAKILTIKADTYEAVVAFALPDGTTTTEFASESMYKR